MPLTDVKIKNLKPKSKSYKETDYEGLKISVSPKGVKSWKLRYQFDGKPVDVGLGKYPAITLQMARQEKNRIREMAQRGEDYRLEKSIAKATCSASRSDETFANMSERFIEKARKEGKSKATIQKLEWLLNDANEDFGTIHMTEVTPAMVLATLRKREKQGNYETANRMRSRISAVFRYAIANGTCQSDPAAALQGALVRPKVTHRAAIVTESGLIRLVNAIDKYNGQPRTKLGLKLLMMFATRPVELRKARWEEFDFENRFWTIPAERMKKRKEHVVPLADEAVEVLLELKKITGWAELILPAQTSSKKPISENTFNQALRRMGFKKEEATSHGFRSTFSTFANESSNNWKPDAIEAYCARQDTNTTRRAYNRSKYWDERVALAEWWAKKLTDLID